MAGTSTPRTLYVHDDLSDDLGAYAESSPTRRLGRALLSRLRRHPERVVVLTLSAQLDALIAAGHHASFAIAVGIGGAGARVASQIHARTGWFPAIHRVDVWREEDEAGEYVLAGPAPLGVQLAALEQASSVAVVDDTVFSGLTMRSVLAALPRGQRRLHAFCLRAVGDSLHEIRRLAPVTAGFAAPGRILADVSFINASGLVRRTAIRRVGQPCLAFFERPEWMAAWFPEDHQEIIAICRELCAALETAPATRCG